MICSRQLNAISSNRCGSFARGRGGTEVRAEWFSINNAISQAVLTNPGVGEASANRRATEAELRPDGELKLIAPAFVVVGNEDCPGCVPADLPDPREARSPASNTVVVRPPGDGTVTVGFGETAAILCLNGPSSASLARARQTLLLKQRQRTHSSQNINRGIMKIGTTRRNDAGRAQNRLVLGN